MTARIARRAAPAAAAALVLAAAVSVPQRAAAQEEPETAPASRLRERVEVRLVQVDVSVIDPKGSSYASVRGLKKDDFVVRLDGRDLTPEQRGGLRVDELCEQGPAPPADLPGPAGASLAGAPDRPVLAFIDFNYLDAQGRRNVARAFDTIAETIEDRRAAFKVYGYTRELRMLTSGFTRSPDELRGVAELVRRTAHRVKPAGLADGVSTADGPVLDLLDAEIARDPQPSFSQQVAQATQGLPGAGSANIVLAEIRYSNVWGDALSDFDPGASLAALRTIMLAHAHIPWRKGLVLFTSEAFRFTDREREDWELMKIRELARRGYTIWTVDVEGISRAATGISRLVSSMASDSGGHSLRRTADLARSIDGASEQLSCYYLISLPVAGEPGKAVRHTLTVKLDREGVSEERARELFRYQVRAPSEVYAPDPKSRLVETRLSALISPDDFERPPVNVTLDFPVRISGEQVSKVRLRVPLASLAWEPAASGGALVARVLPAAVVQRNTKRGQAQVCGVDAEQQGPLELSLPEAPSAGSAAALAVEFPCTLEEEGFYTARGVLTDLVAGTTGAGRSSMIVEHDGSERWRVLGARVEAVSGLDLVWSPGVDKAVVDGGRIAWRTVTAGSGVARDEEVALRYLLCGPDAGGAASALRHLLVRRDADGTARPVVWFRPASLRLLDDEPGEGFCSQAAVVLPPFSLEQPGDYAFVVTDPSTALEDVEPAIARALADARRQRAPESGLHAVVPFSVAER